jgi:K+ transporter
VLSALDGIKTPVPGFAPYVLPLSIFVLIALFCLQPQGTATTTTRCGILRAEFGVVLRF